MRELFTTIETQGALLPVDLLQRVAAGDRDLDGLGPGDYHLLGGERFNEVISRSWNRLLGAWSAFRAELERLPAGERGTTMTRDRWLLPLFQELGYGRLPTATAIQLDGKSYPVSHGWGAHLPIHLVGAAVDLDRRTAGVAGAARMSPHSMLQELLNHSDDRLWGFVSSGLRLRLLRDNVRLTKQAFVEFDLQGMLDGEVYADFVVLWLLCHQSRFEGQRPEQFWIERWSQAAAERGTRALDQLRDGVERAIAALGRGLLAHPANGGLRDALRAGALDPQDYYRQLLRVIYRLLFLFVTEDRDLLLAPAAAPEARRRYLDYYGTQRLRRLAERRRGTRHADLWRALWLVFEQLGKDEGCPPLGLPGLGGFLWSAEAAPDLAGRELANADLLDAIRQLAFFEAQQVRRPVDYRNLGAEELGSIYESLLELHPQVNLGTASFELATAGGNERKTTGSYYTPSSLIAELLDSALEPVLDDRLQEAADPERALLDVKVVDPAAGSGHFLVAAAHRIARRLAAVRTGDEEPSPAATRTALRDVIGRCLYGVDINPMAVELCKVSLWLEAMEPGKPLSFLDHHIQTGNSLLGATPALLAAGIPDEAFTAITGDDKTYVSDWKKRNKQQRKGQQTFDHQLAAAPWERLGDFAAAMQGIERIAGETVAEVRRKQALWEQTLRSSGYAYSKLWADAWCAAFVWKKTREWAHPITEAEFRRIERTPHALHPDWRAEIERLAAQYRFFHWHLAFPDVFRVHGPDERPQSEQTGWLGGFDVVLGNPPWERIKLQEKEWFAERRPDIANAPNAAARKRMIEALKTDAPTVYADFQDALRQADGESRYARTSGRYSFAGRGDVNTYSLFLESARTILKPTGRAGMVIPDTFATSDTTAPFFRDLVESRSLRSLYGFKNERFLFTGIEHTVTFALVTIGGDAVRFNEMEFCWLAWTIDEMQDPIRRVTLTPDDFRLLNPNTRTCPIFRSERDADLTKAVYRRVPVLIEEGPPDRNLWGIKFTTMFHMANDSHLFRTRDELESRGGRLESNVFHMPDGHIFLPLYEAKMFHHFDHRFGSYESRGSERGFATLPIVALDQYSSSCYTPVPFYWVSSSAVDERVPDKWNRDWLFAFRDICRNTDGRTVIASVLPQVGVGHKAPLIFVNTGWSITSLASNLGAFCFDYIARQKYASTSLAYFYMTQFPVLPPETYEQPALWEPSVFLDEWLLPRFLELTYTAWDLEPFARDCGYAGPPFRWDEERRFLLRCELDAAYFHLYGIAREDVDYIMETFPIVKRKDVAAHGTYRTKETILAIYDELAEAMQSGVPYQTRLDPPPADPSVAHDEGTRPSWAQARLERVSDD